MNFTHAKIIGIDHGYGNIKTANTCFRTGVTEHDKEPVFKENLLIFKDRYYTIGEEHKEFSAEKMKDLDYYILTLGAIASELELTGVHYADVFVAAGLPLTWVSEQKETFREYLLQNENVRFTFRGQKYQIRFCGAEIYPQGISAIASHIVDFRGTHMLCDIGNGTMNIVKINNGKIIPQTCFTEKYGTFQCMKIIREELMKRFGATAEDEVIEEVLRTGTADIGRKYLEVIQASARKYVAGIMRKLREHDYNPELMRLYVVGGGGCLIQNFGDYNVDRVTIDNDICATAKGYEYIASAKIQKAGMS